MLLLKEYQEKSIDELKYTLSRLLKSEIDNSTCVFQAPTGSGKTIIMAEVIKRLIDGEHDHNLAFIWITVNKLHDQSKIKLEKYYKNFKTISCSNFVCLQNNAIQNNEILFLNWSSVNNDDKIIMKDNEEENNLPHIIENTKDDGRVLILIIDESHHTANTQTSQNIISNMSPKITIEISATPKIIPDDMVSIHHDEVRSEGMIKKSILLNHKLSNKKYDIDKTIIKAALDKRVDLKQRYVDHGSKVNPLVLIQLPDNMQGIKDKKKELENILDHEYNISVKKENLGIWLSNEKKHIENISDMDNDVEVLIFKQAIALGWDCPRASILVLFKEWKSITFTIQTIGRIMRMPEHKHYDDEELDKSHIYTNVKEVNIIEDFAKDYISTSKCKRDDSLYDNTNLKLNSTYLQRQHKKTRLSGDFHDIFYTEAKKFNLLKKINLNPNKYSEEIIIDGEIKNSDDSTIIRGDTADFTISPTRMQEVYTNFLRDSVEGFAKHRSSEILRRSIYTFLEKNNVDDYDRTQKIVLSPKNISYFQQVISDAKETYRKKIVKNIKRDIVKTPEWSVPSSIDYTGKYVEGDYKKSIMIPAFVKSDSRLELEFMDYIDDVSHNVKWWFKNGVNDKKYFAITYIKSTDQLPHSFYVDFIIYTKDGMVYLIDTKEGQTAEDAHDKANALQKYIKNKSNDKLVGGIVTRTRNGWLINNNREYHYNREDLSEWQTLNFD